MIILGIETSCDETAVSVVEASGDIDAPEFKLLGSAVNSQIEIHKPYGGVFPALAKREHQKNLPVVYEEALKKAGIDESEIDFVAVTVGPGLEPALWTGINFAEELSKKLNKKIIPTNHMDGHLVSVLFGAKKVEFPAMGLLISGGHTEFVYLKNWLEKEKLGETQDDAVGEAFDKVARMLGLPYPGGPEISALAEQARNSNIDLPAEASAQAGIRNKKFPRPMIHSGDLNFSFSGLKTAVLYYIKNLGGELSQKKKMEIAREFEDAIVETLLFKTKKAIERHSPKTLIIGGGVIANKTLRENFLKLKNEYADLEVLIPEKYLTTDNATMIAAAGFLQYLKSGPNRELRAQGNMSFD